MENSGCCKWKTAWYIPDNFPICKGFSFYCTLKQCNKTVTDRFCKASVEAKNELVHIFLKVLKFPSSIFTKDQLFFSLKHKYIWSSIKSKSYTFPSKPFTLFHLILSLKQSSVKYRPFEVNTKSCFGLDGLNVYYSSLTSNSNFPVFSSFLRYRPSDLRK